MIRTLRLMILLLLALYYLLWCHLNSTHSQSDSLLRKSTIVSAGTNPVIGQNEMSISKNAFRFWAASPELFMSLLLCWKTELCIVSKNTKVAVLSSSKSALDFCVVQRLYFNRLSLLLLSLIYISKCKKLVYQIDWIYNRFNVEQRLTWKLIL